MGGVLVQLEAKTGVQVLRGVICRGWGRREGSPSKDGGGERRAVINPGNAATDCRGRELWWLGAKMLEWSIDDADLCEEDKCQLRTSSVSSSLSKLSQKICSCTLSHELANPFPSCLCYHPFV